ncbi:MAG: nucleoside recognition domain-containing protein [Hymenobacter sp.]
MLEETGYMARVTFLMDKLMRPFGLSGKSVVPLISGLACAVPAIMGARTIESWKDRMLTIFVTPLMSCSARIPVYTVLVALVVPDEARGHFQPARRGADGPVPAGAVLGAWLGAGC